MTSVRGPLLERAALLSELAAHLDLTAAGRGRLVLLRGEAGVGKTALVRRFAEQIAPGARTLIGGCDPLSTPGPLGPVLDIAADLGAGVEDALTDALTGQGGQQGVFRALLARLRGEERPTVLVLEDLHWADGATFDLVRFLGRRIESVPVLLLVTFRDDEVGGRHPLRMMLGDLAGCLALYRMSIEPLSRSAVTELAAGHSRDVGALYRATGGNPFFVTEVLASPTEEIPQSVSDVVLGRLARLAPDARAVAEAVSVIGSPADLRLVAALVPDVAATASASVASGLLVPDGAALAFRHDVARMAVFDSIPRYRRIGLHGRVLAALRSSPPHADQLAQLAHHAEEAGDQEAVLEFAPAAAGHAAALRAHAEAADQYERALRYADGWPARQRAALLEGHSAESFLASDNSAAITSGQAAVELRGELGDRLREGDNLRRLAHVLRTVGRMAESRVAIDAAERLLEALPPSSALVEVYVYRCLALSYQADVDGTTVYARKAIELGERLGDPRPGIQARYYLARARVAQTGAGWEDLERSLEAAVGADLEERTGFLFMTASAVASLHRDQRGRAVMARAEQYCAANDMLTYLLATRAHGTLHPLHRGRWSEAADTASAVLAHPRAAPIVRPPALAALGLVRARRGDPDAAAPLDEAARLLEPGYVLHMNPVWEARAEAAGLNGDDGRARSEARIGLAVLSEHSDPWLCGALARWVRLAGGEPPSYPAAGPFALELAGEWRAAAADWDELGCAYDGALARLAGDAPAVLTALDTFASLGARPAVERARARLRSLGVRPGVRGPRASTLGDLHGLTTRQREILELVGGGLTDAQIAARLHLSAKTVNNHVTTVMAKLGVHSRTDAVRKLELR